MLRGSSRRRICLCNIPTMVLYQIVLNRVSDFGIVFSKLIAKAIYYCNQFMPFLMNRTWSIASH